LTGAVKKVGKDWVAVATLVPLRTNEQRRQRWAANLDPNINRTMGVWTVEEDACNTIWVQEARRVPGRTDKHCRGRWYKYPQVGTKTFDLTVNTAGIEDLGMFLNGLISSSVPQK
jgi:hypothetical protein